MSWTLCFFTLTFSSSNHHKQSTATRNHFCSFWNNRVKPYNYSHTSLFYCVIRSRAQRHTGKHKGKKKREKKISIDNFAMGTEFAIPDWYEAHPHNKMIQVCAALSAHTYADVRTRLSRVCVYACSWGQQWCCQRHRPVWPRWVTKTVENQHRLLLKAFTVVSQSGLLCYSGSVIPQQTLQTSTDPSHQLDGRPTTRCHPAFIEKRTYGFWLSLTSSKKWRDCAQMMRTLCQKNTQERVWITLKWSGLTAEAETRSKCE